MVLKSKLLDKKVMEQAKETLKEARNIALTIWVKHLKFGREEKLSARLQRRRKIKLNWS
ncbi:hypothetical protein GOY07_03125 [Wolbachia endosymbiont of Litomosoides sigmodontis]|uniref:hypothetical protein n=1 Tax=Wolbachia endosymbiont of Litomosoides sigmodontis TaxID=80850 RepID=UPI0015888CEA|nr:hypothetical protein [Wolbachia endosymbiont of Litomosoides sigmodontis]QKX03152.1 hypothetical protein GOY07_03125 [Wolbachia endosymbiont of Litomosoides sigmodontis]